MRSAFVILALSCQGLGRSTSYSLDVSGTVAASTRGRAEAGVVGTAREQCFTISLGGIDGAAAVVLTRASGEPLRPGTYAVGDEAFRNGGFSGLIVTGEPAHPTGVFWAWSGRIEVIAAAPHRITGRFELDALGYLTSSPDVVWRAVTARGTFAANPSRGIQP